MEKKMIMVLVLVAVDYVCVLLGVLADLRSGIMKAKRTGKRRSSQGYRRTVEKAGRYYVTLFAMTVIDAMIVGAVFFVELTGGPSLPPLPLFTSLGAIGLCSIELKSIYENSQEKGDYDKLLKNLKAALKNPVVIDAMKDLLK